MIYSNPGVEKPREGEGSGRRKGKTRSCGLLISLGLEQHGQAEYRTFICIGHCMTWSCCWESTEHPTSSGESLPCCSAQVCAIPQASETLHSQQKQTQPRAKWKGWGWFPLLENLENLEFRTKNIKLFPEHSVL